jgi:hypothetical protein
MVRAAASAWVECHLTGTEVMALPVCAARASRLREELMMSEYFLDYLQREHARLDAEIRDEERRRYPDQVLVARLKKLKLAVKDQMAGHHPNSGQCRAA